MILCPFLSTYIAKLISAPASHMIAPLVLLNHKLTLFALPIVQTILKKPQLLKLTLALVRLQKAPSAEFPFAGAAQHQFLACWLENTFALLARTHPKLGVPRRKAKAMDLSVLLLYLYG